MTYVARGKKVFLHQDPLYPDCTPPAPKRSDHRLKRFQSTLDCRAWNFCDEVRSKYFRDLFSGSQTCLGIDQCHRYVPLEDLIKILTGEKPTAGDGDKEGLQNKIASLTEEVNKSRDMLRKAMHKLQNIDEIVNENKKLQCRLRCSEERVKFLEEKKKHLECELADLRSKSQIQMDLDRAQERLCRIAKQRESKETDEQLLQCLALERDELQEKVKKLENELEESKKKEAEIEMLKKRSESDSLDREEMSRENECYRRKLASMKCLEKQIQELKKQGRSLADKYKKEAQKAAEQMNKMAQAMKELQALREERDSLRKRVNELASLECQYNKLQRKLQRVDAVIAENEALNSKLMALKKLEKENEYLRCRLEAIQEMEMSAADDKERIMQLQCAVADQEEEMKDLLGQIERLTSGRHEEELERLRCELHEKSSKLKLCEEQLAEIPMLEAEIDELRVKLQCCCKEFPDKKRGESNYQKVEVRFPASSMGIRANYKTPAEKCSSVLGVRREEKVELKDKHGRCQEILQENSEKVYKVASRVNQRSDAMSCEEVQSLLQSSKGIISCVLEDMIEHQKEMEELETCNRNMKEEIEALKARVGGSDKDCLLEEIKTLKDLNRQMKAELEAACAGLKQVENLEKMLKKEQEARCQAETKLRGEGTSTSAVGDLESDRCKALQQETDDLKLQIEALNKLAEELRKENELLRELQKPCPDFSKELDEKCALENLLSLLQAELDAYKGQKLSDECEALRKELKRVMEQNCQLKALVACYRERLELEKQSNEEGIQSDVKEKSAASPPGGETDCQSELEKLRKQKEQLEKQLEEVKKDETAKNTPQVAQAGAQTTEAKNAPQVAQAGAQTTESKNTPQVAQAGAQASDDCQKELEKLKKQLQDAGDRLKQAEAENAEKLKKLMDQHEKQLADRDKTYQDNLTAMKSGYETDIRKLSDRHKQSIVRLQDLHEDEVQEMNSNQENQPPASESGDISDRLKAQHGREMQKARRASKQKLDALKETMEDERKKSAATIESLKTQVKDQGACNCKFSKKKRPKPRDPSCPLDFNEVLEKILEEGLDCLTFNEIALVHRKTCCALEQMVMNSNKCFVLEMEPPVGDGCPHSPLLEADKQQLLGKIFALESEIAQKQKRTEEAIINMEMAIKKERCRLQEVKNSLQNEQQKNLELKLLLSSQTKLQEDLKKERDRLGNQASVHQSLCREKSKQLDEETRSKNCLKAEVERLRDTLKQLRTAMDTERGNFDREQGNQIELMRMKMQQSIQQERRLAQQLENETKCRMQLQCQLQTLRQSLKHMVNLPAVENVDKLSQNPSEAKCDKNRKNLDQIKEKKSKIKTKAPRRHKK